MYSGCVTWGFFGGLPRDVGVGLAPPVISSADPSVLRVRPYQRILRAPLELGITSKSMIPSSPMPVIWPTTAPGVPATSQNEVMSSVRGALVSVERETLASGANGVFTFGLFVSAVFVCEGINS